MHVVETKKLDGRGVDVWGAPSAMFLKLKLNSNFRVNMTLKLKFDANKSALKKKIVKNL